MKQKKVICLHTDRLGHPYLACPEEFLTLDEIRAMSPEDITKHEDRILKLRKKMVEKLRGDNG